MKTLLPLALLGLAFWFLVIRPTRRQRAAAAQLVASLTPGAKVTTAGGLRGTVVSVDEEDVVLEVADGVHLHFVPGAIRAVARNPEGEAEGELPAGQEAEAATGHADSTEDPPEPTT